MTINEDNDIILDNLNISLEKGIPIENKEIVIIGKLKKELEYKNFQQIYINQEGYEALQEAFKILEKENLMYIYGSKINIILWDNIYFKNDNDLKSKIQGCIYSEDEDDPIILEQLEFVLEFKDLNQIIYTEDDAL